MKLGITGFVSDIFNFVKKGGRVLGVDVGTASIKVVELSRQGKGFNLHNYGILETQEHLESGGRVIQSSSVRIVDDRAGGLLSLLLSEMGTHSKVALVSVPAFSVFTTFFEMPFLSPAEMGPAVMFQARRFIPLPAEEVSIDWVSVGEFERRGQRYKRIFLMGIPREVVKTYERICEVAGIHMAGLELEGLALARAVTASEPRTHLVVDIGAGATTILVAEGDVLRQSVQVDQGGVNLTYGLHKSLGLSIARAEKLKRRRGLLGKGGEAELSTLLLSLLDVIIEEVRSVRAAFEKKYPDTKISQVVLVGGGVNLLGIDAYVQDRLGLPVRHADLFWDVAYNTAMEPAVRRLQNELPVAIGTAKRYFS
jgi:type IV pilus assembly protein PilM